MAEFKGNVVAVEPAPFWEDELAMIDAKREQIGQMQVVSRRRAPP